MKIRELADLIGVTENTVINWEKRAAILRKEHLETLKRMLEI